VLAFTGGASGARGGGTGGVPVQGSPDDLGPSDGLTALWLLGERLMVNDDQAAGSHCLRYSACRVLGGDRGAGVPMVMTK
jgi:hypothetical protein